MTRKLSSPPSQTGFPSSTVDNRPRVRIARARWSHRWLCDSVVVFDVATSEPGAQNRNRRLRSMRFPDWLVPMAATLTQDRFVGPEWSFEQKFDGIRLLSFKN